MKKNDLGWKKIEWGNEKNGGGAKKFDMLPRGSEEVNWGFESKNFEFLALRKKMLSLLEIIQALFDIRFLGGQFLNKKFICAAKNV